MSMSDRTRVYRTEGAAAAPRASRRKQKMDYVLLLHCAAPCAGWRRKRKKNAPPPPPPPGRPEQLFLPNAKTVCFGDRIAPKWGETCEKPTQYQSHHLPGSLVPLVRRRGRVNKKIVAQLRARRRRERGVGGAGVTTFPPRANSLSSLITHTLTL